MCKWRYKICRCYIISFKEKNQHFSVFPLCSPISSFPSFLLGPSLSHHVALSSFLALPRCVAEFRAQAYEMIDHIIPSGSARPAELSLKPGRKTTLVSTGQNCAGQSSQWPLLSTVMNYSSWSMSLQVHAFILQRFALTMCLAILALRTLQRTKQTSVPSHRSSHVTIHFHNLLGSGSFYK